MRYYPVFFDIANARCLVLGAGGVGRRKARTLLSAGAHVILVDPFSAPDEDPELAATPGLSWYSRDFNDVDLDGVILAFAASGNREANAALVNRCRERNIPCNVADKPEEGTFILPAVHCQEDLVLAVSTGGASPALARHAREKLEASFGREYAALCRLLGHLRPLVLALNLSQPENRDIFRSLVDDEILDALRDRDWTKCENSLKARLPQALHQHVGDLYAFYKDL